MTRKGSPAPISRQASVSPTLATVIIQPQNKATVVVHPVWKPSVTSKEG